MHNMMRLRMMRLRFNVLSIDFVRVTNCFYDYDYDYFFRAVTEEIQFTQALSLNWRFTRQSYISHGQPYIVVVNPPQICLLL